MPSLEHFPFGGVQTQISGGSGRLFIGHPVVEFIGEAISETQGSLRKCALKGMVHAGRTEETDADHSLARRTLMELR